MLSISRRAFLIFSFLGAKTFGLTPQSPLPAPNYRPPDPDNDDSGPPDLGNTWYRVDTFPYLGNIDVFRIRVESVLAGLASGIRELRPEKDKGEGIVTGIRTTKVTFPITEGWFFSRTHTEYFQYQILLRAVDGTKDVVIRLRNGRKDTEDGQVIFPGPTPKADTLTKELGLALRAGLRA